MTAPHYADDAVTLLHGDCLQVLAELEDASVDAVVTDPPYGIGFMGHQWDQPGAHGPLRANGRPSVHRRRQDGDLELISQGAMEAGRYDLSRAANARFQDWCEVWAAECLRVLKPGGHFVSFEGARTWHRLAAAVEDVGFEVRDSIAWLYGSGFPKSLDVSKAIDRAAAAEREVVGSKLGQPGYSLAKGRPSAVNFGPQTGDPQREAEITAPATPAAQQWQGWGTALKPSFEPIVLARKPLAGTVAANVLMHGTGALNVDGCRVPAGDAAYGANHSGDRGHSGTRAPDGTAATDLSPGGGTAAGGGRWPTNVVVDEHLAEDLDEQSGLLRSGANPTRRGSDKFRDAYGEFRGQEQCTPARGADEGGASRFFPVFRYEAKAAAAERPREGDVTHPTVKPLDLMRWLVRLVTPPGGLVLDPFAGSGTTAEAAVVEGFRCLTIEREAAYLPLIVGRLSKPIQAVLL